MLKHVEIGICKQPYPHVEACGNRDIQTALSLMLKHVEIGICKQPYLHAEACGNGAQKQKVYYRWL